LLLEQVSTFNTYEMIHKIPFTLIYITKERLFTQTILHMNNCSWFITLD